MTRLVAILPAALLALAGCQSSGPTTLPRGAAAYQMMPAVQQAAVVPEARGLQPGDTIAVQVYREPDLSADKLIVDELGNVQLPLLGLMPAAGNTPVELSRLIADRLGARYLRNPRVTVALLNSVAKTVTVEGQVADPGVFQVRPNETLLSTLAQANSPIQTAKLDEVVVFRSVEGKRMGAVFNVNHIRTGRAPDPQIVDGDVVVVGFSQVKGAFRDFLTASPLLNLFTVF